MIPINSVNLYFDPFHKSVFQTVIKLEKDSFEAKKNVKFNNFAQDLV